MQGVLLVFAVCQHDHTGYWGSLVAQVNLSNVHSRMTKIQTMKFLRSFSIIYQNTRIPTITKLSAPLAKHYEGLSNHFTWQRYLFFHLLSTHGLLCISSWRTTERESAVGYRLCHHQLKRFWFQERRKREGDQQATQRRNCVGSSLWTKAKPSSPGELVLYEN